MSYNLNSDAQKQDVKAQNLARARQSLIEELDTINVYEERYQASNNPKLKKFWLIIGMKKKSMQLC